MNRRLTIILIAAAALWLACNLDKDDGKEGVETRALLMTTEIDDMDPPPPGLTTPFTSIEEWLLYLSETEPPAKTQLNYHFALFESAEGNVLSISGLNTYHPQPDHSITRIEYKPRDRYYNYPATGNKTPVEVKQEVTRALRQFISGTHFNGSLLAKGRSITTDWDGEIWKQQH
jgi:hypothetical protein